MRRLFESCFPTTLNRSRSTSLAHRFLVVASPSARIREEFKNLTIKDMERWISDKATDPNFILDAPEFDPHFGDEGEDCRRAAESASVSGALHIVVCLSFCVSASAGAA